MFLTEETLPAERKPAMKEETGHPKEGSGEDKPPRREVEKRTKTSNREPSDEDEPAVEKVEVERQ